MYIPYVVQPGDSLYYIAKMFSTSEEEVKAANCLANPGLIQVGQLLYIPVSQPTRPVRHPGVIPLTEQVGTLGSVPQQPTASTIETPVAAPRTLPVTTPPPLEPKLAAPASVLPSPTPQMRTTPAQSPEDRPSFRYAVQAGDSLASLARRFGTTVDAMQQLNPSLSDPNGLPVGQSLLIPLPPRG